MSQSPPNADHPKGRSNAAGSELIAAGGLATRADFRALLWLSGAKLPPGQDAPPKGDAEWAALVKLAYAQRMLPLVGERILALEASQPWVRRNAGLLRAAQWDNTRHTLALAAETLRLLDALEAAGVPTVAFKGCLLSFVAYGNLSRRKGGDIDLLVKKADLSRAAEALAACGYRPYEDRSPARALGHQTFDCEWEWFNAERNVGIDLHWRFSGTNIGLSIPLERFWSRMRTMPFMGRAVRAFSPEDLVLTLCIHHAKHFWLRLEWIATLAAALNRMLTLDWEFLRREARLMGVDRILRLGLLLADDLYGVTLPEEVRAWVKSDATARALALQSLRWLAEDVDAGVALPAQTKMRRYHSAARSGARRKAYYWLCAAATPNVKDFVVKLPRGLRWVYFVIRAVRMGAQGLRWLLLPRRKPPQAHAVQWIPKPAILSDAVPSATEEPTDGPVAPTALTERGDKG